MIMITSDDWHRRIIEKDTAMHNQVQAQVQSLLDELVQTDQERGLQVAAYLDGECIVDAWAGLADATTGRPVDGETLFTVFSTTKGITATVIHWLAERGRLEYDRPIADYWPEFGVNGKAEITVRQALNHTAGLPHLPEGFQPDDLGDWEGLCRGIAALAPLWEPGRQTGYHALSYGHILGEVARRVDGRPVAEIVAAEIARPLGIEFYLGVPAAVEARIAWLEEVPVAADAPPPSPLSLRAIPPSIRPLGDHFNSPALRRASIPAGGGITNARAIARHYAALVGSVAGVRLLSADRVALATALQTEAEDVVLGRAQTKGLGYFLGGPLSAMGERATAFGHPGYGGSIGFADPEHHFAFGLAKTRMVASPPGEGAALLVARTIRAALGIPEYA